MRQDFIRFNNNQKQYELEYEICIFWRLYPRLKKNLKFERANKQLVKTNNGLPKNIMFIVYLVNCITCFSAKIRYCFSVLHWNKKMFLYYNRYYRYLAIERKFGKGKILPKKYSHKTHFIPYLYRRQLTGSRIDKINLHCKL